MVIGEMFPAGEFNELCVLEALNGESKEKPQGVMCPHSGVRRGI